MDDLFLTELVNKVVQNRLPNSSFERATLLGHPDGWRNLPELKGMETFVSAAPLAQMPPVATARRRKRVLFVRKLGYCCCR